MDSTLQGEATLERDAVYVRRLRPADLERVVVLDARIVGRSLVTVRL
ncbi:MAG: hypothetical protein GY711_02750 [bacterium]|nr:hypothetical protein [bacterium]